MLAQRGLLRFLAVTSLLAGFAGSASAQTWTWNTGGAGGSWSNPVNWNPTSVPNANTATANLNSEFIGSDPKTITLDAAITVGAINFGSPTPTVPSWTITPGTGGSFTFSGVGDARTTLSVATGTTATITANTSGNGIIKTGPSTLTLTGTNNYTTGATPGVTISAGTLQIGTGGASTLTGGTITNNATLGINSSANFALGTMSGTGTLTKLGSGTVTLDGANSYTGATTINGGTLSTAVLANGASNSGIGAAGTAASNLVFNGGTLQYTGSGGSTDRGFTLGTAGGTISNTGTGGVNFTNTANIGIAGTGDRTLTLIATNSGGNNTLNSAINTGGGSTSLIKDGDGNWVLTSVHNAYGGTTTVQNGGLYFNGYKSSSGTVSVLSGGTLGGDTNVGAGHGIVGDTTFSAGSALDIGDGTANDIGTLKFFNDVTMAATVNTQFNFSRTGGNTVGSGFDALIVSGNLNLANANFNVVVNDNAGFNTFTTMTIIDAGSLTMGTTFNGLAEGDTVAALNNFGGWNAWIINYDYANGNVNLVPVPEPASVLGVAAAGLGLGRWIRRRKSEVTSAVAV